MKKSLLLLSAALIGVSAAGFARSEKRGYSVNSMMEVDYAALEPGARWFYDWGANPPSDEGPTFMNFDLEFCPMVWNTNYSVETLDAMYAKYGSHVKYVLGYNEPNFTDQAHLTPQQAAADWPRFQNWALSKGLKIVSPAVNWSAWQQYNDPVTWLEEFFDLLPDKGANIDYVACHFYVPTAESLMGNVERLKKFGKPIWVTEYCAASGSISNSATTQMTYMLHALKALEQDPDVFRYAWFMARTGNTSWDAINLLQRFPNQGNLTQLGYAFTYMWDFPVDFYHNPLEAFRAVDFSSMNGIQVAAIPAEMPLADEYKIAVDDLGNGAKNEYVEYQLNFAQAGTYDLDIVAGIRSNTSIELYWNGQKALDLQPLEGTGGVGKYASRKISGVNIPEAGKGILRVVPSRSMQLSQLKFTRTGDAGVESINGDNAQDFTVEGNTIAGAGVEVYTLSGLKVAPENLAAGIYLVRQNGKVKKVQIL